MQQKIKYIHSTMKTEDAEVLERYKELNQARSKPNPLLARCPFLHHLCISSTSAMHYLNE